MLNNVFYIYMPIVISFVSLYPLPIYICLFIIITFLYLVNIPFCISKGIWCHGPPRLRDVSVQVRSNQVEVINGN